MSSYVKALKNYAVFSGRTTRRDFWMFQLFNTAAYFALLLLDHKLTTSTASGMSGLFSDIYSLATLLPGISIGVRRLHDTGQTGWLILLCLIPLIGLIMVFIWATQGDESDNKYGPDPKAAAIPAGNPN